MEYVIPTAAPPNANAGVNALLAIYVFNAEPAPNVIDVTVGVAEKIGVAVPFPCKTVPVAACPILLMITYSAFH